MPQFQYSIFGLQSFIFHCNQYLFFSFLIITCPNISHGQSPGIPYKIGSPIYLNYPTGDPGEFIDYKNQLLFSAGLNVLPGASDIELWKSDGTIQGTVMVKDIVYGYGASNPGYLTKLNDMLYFSANESNFSVGLWKSDGTSAGTKEVKNFQEYSELSELTAVSGSIFFLVYFNNTTALWKTDGTAAGTGKVKDLYEGYDYTESAWNLTHANGNLYFVAYEGQHGGELWKSDGTGLGTRMVKDIDVGITSSFPEGLTDFNGTLLFWANVDSPNAGLWRTDGTAAGTTLIKSISPITGYGNYHYRPKLVIINDSLYFAAQDAQHGEELWKSDGTPVGTQLVKDIISGPGGSSPYPLADVNNTLFFAAKTPTGKNGLWKTDGTQGGTILIKEISNILYQGNYSCSRRTAVANGLLYFLADDGKHGWELWKSDGTADGTLMLADILPGADSSNPSEMTIAGNHLFFTTYTGNYHHFWSMKLLPPRNACTIWHTYQ